MSILKLRDSKGNWIDIPALIGPSGPEGPQGKTGKGIPEGGKPGQILVKGEGNTTRWADAPSTKIWQGPYEEYIANKEAIDQEYVIILTDDPVAPVIEPDIITYTSNPSLISDGVISASLFTTSAEIKTDFVKEETYIEDTGKTFQTTHYIINQTSEPFTLKGFTIEGCDVNGNNRFPIMTTIGASIPINPGSNCVYYHEIDILALCANNYMVITYKVEVD